MTSGQDTRQWDFGQVSALVAVLASATYALGIFTILISVSTMITHNLTTAWYAASIANKNLVVTQGIKQLLWPLIVFVVLVEAATLLVSSFVTTWVIESAATETVRKRTALLPSLYGLSLFRCGFAFNIFHTDLGERREGPEGFVGRISEDIGLGKGMVEEASGRKAGLDAAPALPRAVF